MCFFFFLTSVNILPFANFFIVVGFISFGGAHGVIVIVVGNGIRVQILDETDCISHSTNTLGKGMNPIILPPAIVGQTRFFSLGEATSLGEGKL